jgi:hypothetical protein
MRNERRPTEDERPRGNERPRRDERVIEQDGYVAAEDEAKIAERTEDEDAAEG